MQAWLDDTGAKPRSVEIGRGLAWWRLAWQLFVRQPLWWIGFGLAFIVILLVLSLVPLLGALAAALVTPALMAGFLLAARKVERGGSLEPGDLFAAFRAEALTPLIVLGALLLAGAFAITMVAGLLGLGAVFGVVGGLQGHAGGIIAGLGAGFLAMLVSLLFGAILGMLFWFAPALVVFRGLAPIDAVKASLSASLRNIAPFLLYSLVYFVAAFAASIPFGLGWFVLVPVMLLTAYVSYQDIFGD